MQPEFEKGFIHSPSEGSSKRLKTYLRSSFGVLSVITNKGYISYFMQKLTFSKYEQLPSIKHFIFTHADNVMTEIHIK